MKEWQLWLAIWEKLFHEQLELKERPKLPLPMLLARRFQYACITSQGVNFLLALDKRADTVRNYAQNKERLERLLGLPVIFCLSLLKPYQYGRMFQSRISFMTKSGYVYIPDLLQHIKLNTPQKMLRKEPKEALSPAAQVLLLRHLLFHDVHESSLRSMAEGMPYSAMTISLAKDELEHHGLCSYSRGCLEIMLSDAELWQKAQPFLKSPVQKLRYLRGESSVWSSLPLAGETALCQQSLLMNEGLPTYAVGKSQIKQLLATPGVQEVCQEEAEVVIEHWRYSPDVLTRPGANLVDPLSLYLSLRDSADDRVRQELRKLPLP